jgi:uncharacterized protein YegJ (DUF2314 family)
MEKTFPAALDRAMGHAYAQARATFRFLWRELTWEYRRIIPALEVAAVKIPFSDPGDDNVEVMWIEQVMFDGRRVQGALLNEPNTLTSVKQGDAVDVPLEQIADWMYVLDGRVHGAWTVQLIRARMSASERAEHDAAWGFEFPDPETVSLSPWGEEEHPMSLNAAPELLKMPDAELARHLGPGADGWTMMHSLALGGSAACVEALLKRGADPKLRLPDGRTALDLAIGMGWQPVVDVLRRHGACE